MKLSNTLKQNVEDVSQEMCAVAQKVLMALQNEN